VSFVINGKGDEKGIKKETQKLVLDKIKELGYQPNAFARSLRTGLSKTIGLIVADISNPFYAKLCRSIEDEFSKYSYNVLICSSDENTEKEAKLLNMLMDRQVDGIIITPTAKNPARIKELQDKNIPLVLIDRNYSRFKLPSVSLNNYGISKYAVEYLLDKGHKKIALISISPSYTNVMQARIEGYADALRARNRRMNKTLLFEVDFDKLHSRINEIIPDLIENRKATAVFCLNNSITKEVLKYFRNNNLKIPNDLSLISFDDIEMFSILSPSITSIKQPIEQFGQAAAEKIIQAILKNTAVNKDLKLEFEAKFIERESVREI
jgi:LacI family transcriptional regulator